MGEVVWSCEACGAVGDNAFHTLKCPVARVLRGSWCTPKDLAQLMGTFFIDVCTNERSNIVASVRCNGDAGDDGLLFAKGERWIREKGRVWCVPREARVFCNPPYDHGSVIRWVRHWRSTCFTFLLRWDPSTGWFKELLPHCTHVWFPYERINFEPPPHVSSSSNPFPHALYLRHPPVDLLLRLAPHGYLLPVDRNLLGPQSDPHGKHQRDDRAGSSGENGGQAGSNSGRATGGCIDRTFHTVPCWRGCPAGRGRPVHPGEEAREAGQ